MRCLLPSLVLIAAAWSATADAQSFSPSIDVPVPGGTAGIAEALGMAPPGRAVFLPELARHIYGVPEGKSTETDRLLAVLGSYLDGVDRFEKALAAVQPRTGAVSLALATDKNGRKRLKEFLDLLGLTLREKGSTYSVATSTDKKAGERAPLLHRLGVDSAQIARRLTAGESVRVEVKSELVPLPLDSATWSGVILQEQIVPERLFATVMSDRRAALLAYGLAWLDDDTLMYLAQNPALLRRVFEGHSPIFAAFGRSLRVRNNKVAVPGGSAAEDLWEAVVDEKVSRPDRFIRSLLDKHDGRLAYLYDAIGSLDTVHARFALGLWIEDRPLRAERFDALERVSRSAFEPFKPRTWPFIRPADDVAIMLARVSVEPDGAPAPPNWRKLWEKVFDGADLPDDAAREIRNLRQDGTVDAAWLAEHTLLEPRAAERAERLDLISFGQRAFRTAPDAALPDVLTSLRGFVRLRTLMLTLDRLHVSDPGLYAAAARRASAMTTLDRDRSFVLMAQFQSALALVARLHAVRTLDTPRAHQLVRDLVAIDPGEGRYRGAVARWFDESLTPALPSAKEAPEEQRILQALAGVGDGTEPARTITFEERTYRVDLQGAELRRLTEVRRKQGGYSLPQVLAFVRAVRHLEALDPRTATVADVRQASESLKRLGGPLKPDKIPPPPGLEAARDPRRVLAQAIKDLGKITKPKDVKKTGQVLGPLYELGDALLARTLVSCVYALAAGDPGGTVLLGGDPSRRHDFGFLIGDDESRRRAPWLVPSEQLQAGVPWHVLGSLLALDVGLSRLALRRVANDKPVEHPDALNDNDRRTFVESLALLDPADLADGERDDIAGAIARGRARLAAVSDAVALETLAAEVHSLRVDGLRRRALRWTRENAPAETAEWVSITELTTLGKPAGSLHAWGMSGIPLDACLCTRLHVDTPWQILTSQTTLGLLPTAVADLNLRVLEISAEMKIPAGLVRPILAAAVQSYLDEVQPSDPDDWMTLVRAAQRITREAVEDYMAGLTANGTLVPAGPGGTLSAGRQ